MNSHITAKFRETFSELPADVRKQARQAYHLFIENPHHPSLRMDRGQIVERGTNEELMEMGGPYSQLYETQFRGECV